MPLSCAVQMGQKVFQINTATLQKMLAALNECTEWGQARR